MGRLGGGLDESAGNNHVIKCCSILIEDIYSIIKLAMRIIPGMGITELSRLLSDHPSTSLRLRPEAQPEGTGLDSTAITADAGGNKVAELRYTAFGDTWGSTPTRRQYTG